MAETNPASPQLTRDDAQVLCDRYAIHLLLDDEEEVEELEENNPDLLRACEILRAIADGDDA